jgi:hypothetical protein
MIEAQQPTVYRVGGLLRRGQERFSIGEKKHETKQAGKQADQSRQTPITRNPSFSAALPNRRSRVTNGKP